MDTVTEVEEWRGVPGYENLYEVSSHGRIRSVRKNRIITYDVNRVGYLRIAMWVNGSRIRFMVHQLVAKLWHENPNNLPEVNHKDRNKRNNHKDNLEWIDRPGNMKHVYAWKSQYSENPF